MDEDERRLIVQTLATYNAEVARGIEHNPEWKRMMAIYQTMFDAGELSSRKEFPMEAHDAQVPEIPVWS